MTFIKGGILSATQINKLANGSSSGLTKLATLYFNNKNKITIEPGKFYSVSTWNCRNEDWENAEIPADADLAIIERCDMGNWDCAMVGFEVNTTTVKLSIINVFDKIVEMDVDYFDPFTISYYKI